MLKHSLKPAQLTNDFVVTVHDKDWTKEWMELLSNQTTRAEINLVHKSVVLDIRQLRKGHIQDLLFHVLNADSTEARKIDEIRIRPAKRQSYEYIFSSGRLTDHAVAFDYDMVNPVTHRVKFMFNQVRLHSKEDHAIKDIVDI